MEVALTFCLPSPLLMTIVEDDTIHGIFENVDKEHSASTIPQVNIRVKEEGQKVTKKDAQEDKVCTEDGSSERAWDQGEVVKVEYNPKVSNS